jgi:hypothetical protein
VTATRASVELTSGTIDIWPADDAQTKVARADEGWQRFDGAAATTITATASTLTEAAAKASVDRCLAAGAKARALAAAIAAPDASLATLAPQHVVARRLARAACAVSRVRTSALADSPGAAGLANAAVAADAVWRELKE